ncbi:MAG: basic secretory protein-like protein [Candidatus Pseudobacter hemicellulosilyticus]|uniref:Basic secretory protein-like protein n=1 Tax=Candidatus Pseudobacter hemicellulosilyticus TaxID=3121375 RepID=A0AAJ5WM75_9BACT|nr:MAG: basic secretory protein-like protein [Pseudobacter sp.]
MKKTTFLWCCLLASATVLGQETARTDSFSKKGYQLIVIDKTTDLDPNVKQRMVDAFFVVYPKLAKAYNKKTLKRVTFIYDPAYTGVAECANGRITYSPTWLKRNPNDIDMVTHETMHIVQSYPWGAGPGWITEGIADYVRHTTGVDNKGGGWSLPEFKKEHSYENAYRVTARFLLWIEQTKKKGFVKKLDAAMRTKTYSPAIWAELTGKNVDELWKEYSENPTVKL